MLSASFADPSADLTPDVLACIRVGADTPDDPRFIRLDTKVLDDFRLDEIWRGAGLARSGRRGCFQFAYDGNYLFGHTRISTDAMADVAATTQQTYAELGAFLKQQGYPVLLRSWNYIHDIHRGAGDAERYRQFCLGRHRATAAPGFEKNLPAATVIGTTAPGMLICFLAGKQPGEQVENPRQISAFQYPRKYGPASPSFSRALLIEQRQLLFMSGTASVVGHATRHPHDSAAQLEEMLANVEALLRHAAAAPAVRWAPQLLRVFLRERADLPAVRVAIGQRLGPDAPVIYLQGDICRSDLRLEIEGVFSRTGTSR